MVDAFMQEVSRFQEALAADDAYAAERIAAEMRMRYPAHVFETVERKGVQVPAYDRPQSAFWEDPLLFSSMCRASALLNSGDNKVAQA